MISNGRVYSSEMGNLLEDESIELRLLKNTTDRANMLLVRSNGYEKIPLKPMNGYNREHWKTDGYSPSQCKSWRDIHAHCGEIPLGTRIDIMQRMQKAHNVTPKDFNFLIETLELEFVSINTALSFPPAGYSEWGPEQRRKYFKEYFNPVKRVSFLKRTISV